MSKVVTGLNNRIYYFFSFLFLTDLLVSFSSHFKHYFFPFVLFAFILYFPILFFSFLLLCFPLSLSFHIILSSLLFFLLFFCFLFVLFYPLFCFCFPSCAFFSPDFCLSFRSSSFSFILFSHSSIRSHLL